MFNTLGTYYIAHGKAPLVYCTRMCVLFGGGEGDMNKARVPKWNWPTGEGITFTELAMVAKDMWSNVGLEGKFA